VARWRPITARLLAITDAPKQLNVVEQLVNLGQSRLHLRHKATIGHARRYLNAIENLARVRRLLKRAPVQVNTVQQQIIANG
jgi:hypothetical protein